MKDVSNQRHSFLLLIAEIFLSLKRQYEMRFILRAPCDGRNSIFPPKQHGRHLALASVFILTLWYKRCFSSDFLWWVPSHYFLPNSNDDILPWLLSPSLFYGIKGVLFFRFPVVGSIPYLSKWRTNFERFTMPRWVCTV